MAGGRPGGGPYLSMQIRRVVVLLQALVVMKNQSGAAEVGVSPTTPSLAVPLQSPQVALPTCVGSLAPVHTLPVA